MNILITLLTASILFNILSYIWLLNQIELKEKYRVLAEILMKRLDLMLTEKIQEISDKLDTFK